VERAHARAHQRNLLAGTLHRAQNRVLYAALARWGYVVWAFKEERGHECHKQHLLELIIRRGRERRLHQCCAKWFAGQRLSGQRRLDQLLEKLEQNFEALLALFLTIEHKLEFIRASIHLTRALSPSSARNLSPRNLTPLTVTPHLTPRGRHSVLWGQGVREVEEVLLQRDSKELEWRQRLEAEGKGKQKAEAAVTQLRQEVQAWERRHASTEQVS